MINYFTDRNGENLKILIEIFWRKVIVSNVISAFLNHLKPKFFLLANHDGQHREPPFFKISGSASVNCVGKYPTLLVLLYLCWYKQKLKSRIDTSFFSNQLICESRSLFQDMTWSFLSINPGLQILADWPFSYTQNSCEGLHLISKFC